VLEGGRGRMAHRAQFGSAQRHSRAPRPVVTGAPCGGGGDSSGGGGGTPGGGGRWGGPPGAGPGWCGDGLPSCCLSRRRVGRRVIP
jgi:hypothetical protein